MHAIYRSTAPTRFYSTQFDGLVGELDGLLRQMHEDGVRSTLLLRDFHIREDFEFLGLTRFRRILELYDEILVLGDKHSLGHTHPDIDRKLALGSAQLVGYVGPLSGPTIGTAARTGDSFG